MATKKNTAKRSSKVKAVKGTVSRKPKPAPARNKVGRSRNVRGADVALAGPASAKRINAAFKTTVLAAEPPIDANLQNLMATFRTKLLAALASLEADGKPFKFVEGFRTVDRQQWLYGSGRPTAVPYGRPGPIVTNADGVIRLSNHQGTGTPGSGKAADCYPTRNGKVYIPPNTDPVWDAYAAAVTAQGLKAGHNFTSIKDSPHCELS